MAGLREIKKLKDEEKALMALATKVNDQLNRLRVEELALINMHRTNPTVEEIKAEKEIPSPKHFDLGKENNSGNEMDCLQDENNMIPLDLNVSSGFNFPSQEVEEEEEEEEEEDEIKEENEEM